MKQESLHELIHSMSSSEKRYFKVFAGGETSGKQQRFLQLFDLLSGMEVFDAEQIQTVMQWENYRASYAMAKRYLYDKVLQSLSAFAKEDTVAAQLVTQLGQVRTLARKGLQQQAVKKITKAKRAALAVEAWEPLLELLAEERQLFVKNTEKILDQKGLEKLNQEINYAIQGISLHQKINDYHYQLFVFIRIHSGFFAEEARKALDQIVAGAKALCVLESPYIAAKANYYNVLQQYQFLIGNLLESQQTLAQIHTLFEKNPPIMREFQGKYLASLNNFCNRAFANSDYAACMRVLHRMRDLRPRDLILRSQWEESYYGLGMTMLVNSGQTQENQAFIAATSKLSDQPSLKIGRAFRLRFHLLLATLYLLQNDLKSVLRHIQKVIQDPAGGSIPAIARVVQLLEVIVHFELGNLDWLEYRAASLLNRKHSKSGFALERAFGRFFQKSLNLITPAEKQALAADFQEELHALRKDAPSAPLFNMFDFDSWAEAKARGKSFREILQENWAKKSGIIVRLLA